MPIYMMKEYIDPNIWKTYSNMSLNLLNASQANHKIMKDDVKNENVKSTMKNENHTSDSSNVCLFLK